MNTQELVDYVERKAKEFFVSELELKTEIDKWQSTIIFSVIHTTQNGRRYLVNSSFSVVRLAEYVDWRDRDNYIEIQFEYMLARLGVIAFKNQA